MMSHVKSDTGSTCIFTFDANAGEISVANDSIGEHRFLPDWFLDATSVPQSQRINRPPGKVLLAAETQLSPTVVGAKATTHPQAKSVSNELETP